MINKDKFMVIKNEKCEKSIFFENTYFCVDFYELNVYNISVDKIALQSTAALIYERIVRSLINSKESDSLILVSFLLTIINFYGEENLI